MVLVDESVQYTTLVSRSTSIACKHTQQVAYMHIWISHSYTVAQYLRKTFLDKVTLSSLKCKQGLPSWELVNHWSSHPFHISYQRSFLRHMSAVLRARHPLVPLHISYQRSFVRHMSAVLRARHPLVPLHISYQRLFVRHMSAVLRARHPLVLPPLPYQLPEIICTSHVCRPESSSSIGPPTPSISVTRDHLYVTCLLSWELVIHWSSHPFHISYQRSFVHHEYLQDCHCVCFLWTISWWEISLRTTCMKQ